MTASEEKARKEKGSRMQATRIVENKGIRGGEEIVGRREGERKKQKRGERWRGDEGTEMCRTKEERRRAYHRTRKVIS